jgi:beta-glucosidase
MLSQIDKALAAANNADVIIACVGENSYCETPGNLTDLWLSENQRNLVKDLAKTGKPIILVLNEGRPRLVADIVPLAKAIVNILLPGNYGADALANLLAGDANFSAKMPYIILVKSIHWLTMIIR